MCNQRHHAYEAGSTYRRDRIDPLSSAQWFDGWTIESPRLWANAPPTDTDDKMPRAAPKSWLLRIGWQKGGGLISPNTIPKLPAGTPEPPQW